MPWKRVNAQSMKSTRLMGPGVPGAFHSTDHKLPEGWRALEDGSSVEIAFPTLRVQSPEHGPFDAPGTLHWAAGSGVTLELLDRRGAKTRTVEEQPGTPLDERDLWSIHGVTTDGFMLELTGTFPDRAAGLDETTHARLGEARLTFRPPVVTLAKVHEGPNALVGACRSGLVAGCPELPWQAATRSHVSSPIGVEDGEAVDAECVKFPNGDQIALRRAGDNQIRCRVLTAVPARFTPLADDVPLALGIASGSFCRWLCWTEEVSFERRHENRIFLASPPRASGRRFAPLDGQAPPEHRSLETLMVRVIDACSGDRELAKILAMMWLCWNPPETYMQSTGLLAATVLEGMFKRVYPDRLKSKVPALELPDPPSKEEIKRVRESLAGSSIGAKLLDRVLGFLGKTRETSGADLLHALKRVRPDVVSEQEIKAWKDIRHPSAHGDFSCEPNDYMRSMEQVFNVMNKLVFLLVGYQGPFRDYSQIGWPYVGFAMSPARTPVPPPPPSAPGTAPAAAAPATPAAEGSASRVPAAPVPPPPLAPSTTSDSPPTTGS